MSGVTINAGEHLGVKLVVDDGSEHVMEFAFDTPYYSGRLELP